MSHAACRIRSLAHWELDMDMDMANCQVTTCVYSATRYWLLLTRGVVQTWKTQLDWMAWGPTGQAIVIPRCVVLCENLSFGRVMKFCDSFRKS